MAQTNRRKARVDTNQPMIVSQLRNIPGVTVITGHDDILVGFRGKTYWIELKSPGAVSKKTGKVKESCVRKSQKNIRTDWTGHYAICATLEEILIEIGLKRKP